MRRLNLVGKQFGRLTVIKPVKKFEKSTRPYIAWLCNCNCGNEIIVRGTLLKNGHTKSCGCFQQESRIKHGVWGTPTYEAWNNMKARCTRFSAINYKDYGGRGIKVCDRWLDSFENFLEDMGEKPEIGLSLDRINNNGNYEPRNCRWATWKEQSRNTRRNRLVEYEGKVKPLITWAEERNMNYPMLVARFNKGFTAEETFNLKPYERRG